MVFPFPPSNLSRPSQAFDLRKITSVGRARATDMPVEQTQNRITPMARRPLRKVLDVFILFCERHRRAKPLGEAPTIQKSILAILRLSYFNELLIFIPLSWTFHFHGSNDYCIFVCSFFAIIPLSQLLSFAICDMGKRVDATLAGLIQAALGNIVELTLATTALLRCELKVVQSSLVGSILCKLLLVPGLCFFFGGMRFSEHGFGASAVHVDASLLLLSVVALLLPTIFHFAHHPEATNRDSPRTENKEAHDILTVSHGVAVTLLFVCLCYFIFRVFSHKNPYKEVTTIQNSVIHTPKHSRQVHVKAKQGAVYATVSDATPGLRHLSIESDYEHAECGLEVGLLEEEDKKPQMSLLVTLMLVTVIIVGLGVTTEFLIESINGLSSSKLISEEFIGLLLFPILGNAEVITIAVKESVEDKLTLTLSATMGSIIQIASFVIPFVVTLAWVLGKPLTLLFDPIESIILFLSVLAVTSVIKDRKSNWLKGLILISLHAIVAVTFWYYPGSDPSGLLSSCV